MSSTSGVHCVCGCKHWSPAPSAAVEHVAKHAGARRCDVAIRRSPGWLLVEIRDDGVGGATLEPGGGLAGLRDRTEALDGHLELISPTGGPTVLRVWLPVPA